MDWHRKGIWILGTDTNVGKTYVTSSIVKAFRARKIDAIPMKPIQTGEGSDIDTCLAATGLDLPRALVNPYRYGPACSPHLAGRLSGRYVDVAQIVQNAKTLLTCHDFIIAEGAGGILVPIDEEKLFLDLVKALPFPVILVARGALGTINHTLLSLQALRSADIPILGVVVTDVTNENGFIRDDNPKAISHFGTVPILADIHFNEEVEWVHLYDTIFA